MTKTDAATTQALYANLGGGMSALAASTVDWTFFGKQIDALIGTAVKAVLEGRQTNAQIRAKQQAARQAFARALARKVAKL